MTLRLYQVDAFTDKLFSGNPAAVIPLTKWLPEKLMQSIAAENNLAETAFFVAKDDHFHIRWFTPVAEVDLCGHATLASAYVIFHYMDFKEDEIRFNSKSGILKVSKDDQLLTLNFPADSFEAILPPPGLFEGIGKNAIEVYQGRSDIMLVYKNESAVKKIKPDYNKLSLLNARGIIVTAPGKKADFVSRFFAPVIEINEDPVTGSAHTLLTPYWSKKLKKKKLNALQLSKRGGKLSCEIKGDRVLISGNAVTYLIGDIEV